jgi:hypothetical protein
MVFGSVSPAGYTLCYKKHVSGSLNASTIDVVMWAYENRVGNDRLRLGRGRGWVIVIRLIQLGRKRTRRSVGGRSIGQRGRAASKCEEGSAEQDPTDTGHHTVSVLQYSTSHGRSRGSRLTRREDWKSLRRQHGCIMHMGPTEYK